MALQYFARKAIYGKIESTSGTAEALSGSDAIETTGVTITPANVVGADKEFDRNYFGADKQITVGATTDISFVNYLAGRGSSGDPRYERFLQACGFKKSSGSYKPISDNIKSLTLRGEAHSITHTIAGCRGTFSLEMSAGALPRINFEFRGLYSDAAAATNTPSYGDIADPYGVSKNNTRVTLLGSTVVMSAFNLSLNNQIEYINDPGREEILILDRNPTGSITVELDSGLSPNFPQKAKNGDTGALQIQHYPSGAAAGRKVTIDLAIVQIANPQYVEAQGRHMVQMDLRVLPGSSGDDEIEFTFA